MSVRPATDFPTGWMNTDAQNPPTGHSSHRLDKNTLSHAPQTPKTSSQWENQDARKPTSSHSRPRPETKAPSIRTEKPVTSQRPETDSCFGEHEPGRHLFQRLGNHSAEAPPPSPITPNHPPTRAGTTSYPQPAIRLSEGSLRKIASNHESLSSSRPTA